MRRYWIKSLRAGWPLYLLVLAVFSLGLVCGALNIDFLPQGGMASLHDYLSAFLKEAGGGRGGTGQLARRVMYDKLYFMTALYLAGLTVIGIPVVLVLVFLRGFALGFTVAFLSRDLALQGLFLAAAAIMPQNLLFLPALFVGAVAALTFALLLFPRRSGMGGKIWGSLVRYTGIMVAVVAVALGAGLVEIYLSPWLTRILAGMIIPR